MKDINEIIEIAKDSASLRGTNLFDVAVISSLEDYARYKKTQEEKEKTLAALRDDCYEIYVEKHSKRNVVSESPPRYRKSISLEKLIEYGEGLENNEDVKTIQIMLFRLFANKCNAEELQRIGEMKPKKPTTIVNKFNEGSQYINTLKKQTNNYGRDYNL